MEIVVTIVVVGVFALIGLLVKSGNKTQETWKQTAHDLGLTFGHGPHSSRYVHATRHLPEMYGQYDGHDIYVGVRRYTTGSGKNQTTHYYTYVDVVFDIPLKRGLQLARADGVSKFFGSIFGQLDIQTGNKPLDVEYRIKGQDEGQIIALVNTPELSELLLTPRGNFYASATDHYVRLEARGIHVDKATLQPILGPTLAIARALHASWLRLPPSLQEQAFEPIARPICEKAGMTYDSRAMRAIGRKDDVDTRVELVLDDKRGWVTEVGARFDPSLAVGLVLKTEGALATIGKLFGAQDIKTGDKTFDKTFVVKGKHYGMVKEMLTTDARAKLMTLREHSDELVVNDDVVTARLHHIAHDADKLSTVLGDVTTAANHMVAHRKLTPTGPYR